jgi:exonuclease SbcC
MIIETIKLKGFISFIDDEVDLRSSHITLVFGPNGEGKSALLEAVPFCFWGEGRGRTIAEYINDKCDTIHVEVTFLIDAVRYKKIRQCGKAGNINELYVDRNSGTLEEAKWRLITDDSKRKTDDELTKILGLNYNIFSNSVFFGQKEASSFIEGTASDRKELLCNLLDIQVYEEAEQLAREQTREIESRIETKSVVLKDKLTISSNKQTVEQKLVSIEKLLKTADADIATLNKQIEASRNKQEKVKIEAANATKSKEQLIELTAQLKSQASLIKQASDDLQKTHDELDIVMDEGTEKVEELQAIIDSKSELLKQQELLKEQITKISEEKKKVPGLKEKLGTYRTSKETLVQKQSEQNTRLQLLKDKKKKIEKSGAICPITDQQCDKLSASSKKQMLADIEIEQKKLDVVLAQIEKDLTTTRELIVDIDSKLDVVVKKTENESKIAAKLSSIESDLKRVNEAVEKLPVIKKKYRAKVDELVATKTKLEARLKKANEDNDKLITKHETMTQVTQRDFDTELLSIARQIKSLNYDLDSLSKNKEEASTNLGMLKKELEQVTQAEADAKVVQKDVDALKESLRVYTELAFAFGKNGIQKNIISVNVPELEENANMLLARFTKSSEFSIKFDLDPKTQSGKAKKQGGLDIIVCRKGGLPRPLNMYSGGETVRIVFAILLSLSNLLTKRAGKRSQTLIIDERIAALDTEGINQFIEIVKYVSDKYKKILIVSHIQELNEAFPNVIFVNKSDAEGSKVNYNMMLGRNNG